MKWYLHYLRMDEYNIRSMKSNTSISAHISWVDHCKIVFDGIANEYLIVKCFLMI